MPAMCRQVGWPWPDSVKKERASTTRPPAPGEYVCYNRTYRRTRRRWEAYMSRTNDNFRRARGTRAGRAYAMHGFFVRASPFDSVAPNRWHGPSLTWRPDRRGDSNFQKQRACGRVELPVLDSVDRSSRVDGAGGNSMVWCVWRKIGL
jgi:hypothetical protein